MNRSRNSNHNSGSYSSSPSGLPNSANRNFNNLNRNDAYRSDYQPKYGTNQQSHDEDTGERYDNVHYGEHRDEQNQNSSVNSFRNQHNPQYSNGQNQADSYASAHQRGRDSMYGEADRNGGQENYADRGYSQQAGGWGRGRGNLNSSGQGNVGQGNVGQGNVGRYAGQDDQQYPSTEKFGGRESPAQWEGNPSTRSSYGADWNLAESHAGRGPKNYKRSDERIHEDVSEALTHAHHVDASEIEVDVKEGIVSLSGTVTDRKTKRWAEELIENLSGVKDVKNNITMGATSTTTSSEGDKSTKKPTTGASKLQ